MSVASGFLFLYLDEARSMRVQTVSCDTKKSWRPIHPKKSSCGCSLFSYWRSSRTLTSPSSKTRKGSRNETPASIRGTRQMAAVNHAYSTYRRCSWGLQVRRYNSVLSNKNPLQYFFPCDLHQRPAPHLAKSSGLHAIEDKFSSPLSAKYKAFTNILRVLPSLKLWLNWLSFLFS